MHRVIPVVVIALIALLAAVLVFNWDSTDTDEVGLVYSSGPIEGRHFQSMVPQGSSLKFLGVLDYMVKLPANQRTYIVAENADEGDVAGGELITATDSEGVAMKFATSSTFDLNQSADKLKVFYEDICTKYNECFDEDGTNDDGWAMMLNDYYRKAQESALQQVTQQYTVDELMQEDRSVFQQKVADATQQKVDANMGGSYLTDITFQIQRPIPPVAVQNKYNEQKAAELQTEVKREEVAQAEQQANAAEKLDAIENSEEYIQLRTIEMLEDCVNTNGCQLPAVMGEGVGANVNVSR